jgi:hypothetical protein
MYTFGRVPTWASMRPSEAARDDVVRSRLCRSAVRRGLGRQHVESVRYKPSSTTPCLRLICTSPTTKCGMSRTSSATGPALPAQLSHHGQGCLRDHSFADPNAKLIGPTASTANQYGVHYLPTYYAAGGATAQDIVGLHAYLYDGSSFSTSPAAITTSITQLRS